MNIKALNKFKNMPESYWIASTETTDFPIFENDADIDTVIIGGGIVGITCAYLLNLEGIDTMILEGNRIALGTSGHTTAKITSQHDIIYSKLKSKMGFEIAKQYADANETAIREIEKIISDNSIDCDLLLQSAFIYTQQKKSMQKIEDEVKAAKQLGIKASYVDRVPFNFSIEAGIRFDDQAQFHPRKFLLALADIITKRGVQIFENSRVVDIEDGNNYIITTEHGKRINAKRVIIASHYPFYNKHGAYFSKIYSERSYIIAIKAKENYPGGMYINADQPARSIRNQPIEDGELIFIGGQHHKTGQGIDTKKHYDALLEFANTIYTVEDIPFRWSTQDCMTLDDLPYVGQFTPNTPYLYVATGFKKWGMTNSMASAMILRDLIVHGNSPWQDAYNPSRRTILPSAKTFIVENLNVAEQLIDGKLSSLPDNVSVDPGEGKILKIDGERVGAYKDDNGQLHFVDTTCTHMGCELNWNSAETTWDCPCHGSRFSYKGEVISGPAVEPLKFGDDVNTLMKLLKEDY
ncbi:MAG: FAD-dependent oxidoreductase [Clostridiales bacterium]|nr:FAD-dependent oxidoreductase [Clostridiales bacterium]